jgi:ribonuclease P protein component
MLGRGWRLTTTKEYSLVYRRGRRVRASGFTFYYLLTNIAQHTRLGVVVSNKVANKANKRNLYKRRLWAAFAEFKKQIFTKGYDLVLVAHPTIKQYDYQDILKEVKRVLSFITPHVVNKNTTK